MPWICKHPECNGGKNGKPRYAYYAKPGEKTPVRCNYHKDDDMVDAANKKTCAHDDCTKRPTFGHNGAYTYCAKHRPEGMKFSGKQNTCAHDGCTTQPKYGHNGAYMYSAKHMLEGMEFSGTQRTCSSDWCTYQVSANKYDGYCTHCFKGLFPNDPRTPKIKGKTKEELVREHINKNFEGFIHDKPMCGEAAIAP
jgi:hypothetical protein